MTLDYKPDTKGTHADPNTGRAEQATPKGRAAVPDQQGAIASHLAALDGGAHNAPSTLSGNAGGPQPTVSDGLGTAGGMTPGLQALDAGRMARQCNGGGKINVGSPPNGTQRSRK